MQKQSFDIVGMSCAACAARVDKAVREVDGVNDCSVALLKNRLTVIYDENKVNDDVIKQAVQNAGYKALDSAAKSFAAKADDAEVRAQKRRLILSVVLTLVLMSVSMGPMIGMILISDAAVSALVQLALTLCVMFIQRDYFKNGFKALFHFSPNMDSLVAVGAGASFLFSLFSLLNLHIGDSYSVLHDSVPLYFESVATILTLVYVGKYFEQKAKLKTTDAVAKLMDLSPKTARVRRNGKETVINADNLKIGDVVILKAGESAPCDGKVISGNAFFDESALSGESRPVKKEAGSDIFTASILSQGYIELEAKAVGADTTFSKIIALIDDATNKKAPIARIADKVAAYFVPAVILVALLTFIVWIILGAQFSTALTFAVSVLVVSCPCALGLATPTAIMAGTGKAASYGVLFKSPDAIEVLHKADTVIFDKTGTLTYGKMAVRFIKSQDKALESINLMMAKSLEEKSDHPLAKAIVAKADELKLVSFPVTDYKLNEGLGVEGRIGDDMYYLGGTRYLSHLDIKVLPEIKKQIDDFEKEGLTVLCLIKNKELQCLFAVGDDIKTEAFATIRKLKEENIKTVMLTGDSAGAAETVAKNLQIDEYRAGLLPQDKADFIKEYQSKGHTVAMVGDGINDALSLTVADVGIGVSGASDIALSSCDAVLMKDSLYDVIIAKIMSGKTIRNIKENLFWAFIYNVICIPMAAGVFYSSFNLRLTPMLAALLMSMSSLCVVTNALRLTAVKVKRYEKQNLQVNLEDNIMKKEILIDGMHCNHCTASVTKALSALPGASDVVVSLEDKKAVLNVGALVNDEMLKSVIEALGFKVTAINNL
ncbi:heavy metal translocating P-type ATPase [Succinatimonas hippei]|uniref:heavy metal translocating P-type ATPase n=1 Tax=Succinatimonas hippei TaxID=626938 RepID=UPI002011EDD2|nr:heavy metal translocating P-type ATPase [Succinatimonas hippei]MCL1603293.1 heavy metal translocating P-type ATPase [Succinatimonas hippei]MDM8120885.1 heavy metal translocating P-type ATPase [Succinatimonas hippei]